MRRGSTTLRNALHKALEKEKKTLYDVFIIVNHLKTLGKNIAILASVLPHGTRVLILLSDHVVSVTAKRKGRRKAEEKNRKETRKEGEHLD